jgi:REP element-mobilizing transposase RayT
MITMTAVSGRPEFSYFVNSTLTLAPLGVRLAHLISTIPEYHPEIALRSWVIMPDHIHILLTVLHPLERPLGQIIAGFAASCTKALWKLYPHYAAQRSPLFNHSFNDRIILRDGQLETVTAYILDNPRRLLIKKANPDLFTRHNHLSIADMEFAAYGNIFLLQDFDRQQVIVHRADTPAERLRHTTEWLQCAENGGVLVSPFISPDEREIRKKAITLGGKIIQLQKEGFEQRFKPAKSDFELCSQGRLLILTPWPDNLRRAPICRDQALYLNSLAAKIASLSP